MPYLRDFFTAFGVKFIEKIKPGDIGGEILKAIVPSTVFTIQIGAATIRITDATVVSWGVLAFILALAWWMGRKPERIPAKNRQVIAESLINLLMNLCQSSGMSYKQAEKVTPFVGSIAVFITLTNVTSFLQIPPPAKNPAFPVALALFTILYVVFTSIRMVGFKGFWRSLTYPKPLLLPFKVLDYFIKPISLSLRLFGNVFGAFVLMEFISIVIPAILPGVIGLWFDLADGILQGVIFSYLTVIYIGEVLEGAHLSAAESDGIPDKALSSAQKPI